MLCPGLVDMRASRWGAGVRISRNHRLGRQAAAAGGITTLAALPDTQPAIDDPALVQLLRTKGEETGSLTILPYGAVTRGCRGEELAELGLLREAGAVAFTDGARAIGPARLMRLALSYARGFGARIVQHPEDPSLAGGGSATESEQATRLGLPGIPAAAEAILVARDIRLARADRRRGAFRPCLDRRGAGADPAGQGSGAGGHLRHRAAVFRPERDRDRRFPHLREAVAAVAQGARPAGGDRGAGGRHDRRHRVRPPAARRRRQAPAVRAGLAGGVGSGDAAGGDAGACA